MLRLLPFLVQYSKSIESFKRIVTMAVVAGALGGVFGTLLLAFITSALSSNASKATLLWSFIGLCLLVPTIRFISELLLIRLSLKVTYHLRVELSGRILAAPLRGLEQAGAARLFAALTEDILAITETLMALPMLCINIAIVIGCIVYLTWLSWIVAAVVAVFMLFGYVSYQVSAKRAMRYVKLVRENWDTLFAHFRALVGGTKELKLHRGRCRAFYDTLKSTAQIIHDNRRAEATIFSAARNWGQILVFGLIGVLVFAVPSAGAMSIAPSVLAGASLTILYMVGPLMTLFNIAPTLARASVAVMKIESLGLSLTSPPVKQAGHLLNAPRRWQRLELKGVTHTYYGENEDESFTLGPMDLTLLPTEMVFITGGNGSGKTTLVKLLSGLYTPEAGEVRLDGEPIAGQNIDDYRQLFSVIFSDFYLFENLNGFDTEELDAKVNQYLVQLQLDKKLKVKDGHLSTIDLSQGQRKRLALLAAYLEDRPVYVFDEWAADQDPKFRETFYHTLLPDLKQRGKTVLVITHDDRYYDVADRIIKLDYGRVEYDKRLTQSQYAPINVAGL